MRQVPPDEAQAVTITYVEPSLHKTVPQDDALPLTLDSESHSKVNEKDIEQPQVTRIATEDAVIKGRSIHFGDNVDTDAVCSPNALAWFALELHD